MALACWVWHQCTLASPFPRSPSFRVPTLHGYCSTLRHPPCMERDTGFRRLNSASFLLVLALVPNFHLFFLYCLFFPALLFLSFFPRFFLSFFLCLFFLSISDIKLANTLRNLGVFLDPTLSFQQQISSVCHICYLELRRVNVIRHYLPEGVTKNLVCAFILSRLDYCNLFLASCPKYLFLNSKRYRTMLQD